MISIENIKKKSIHGIFWTTINIVVTKIFSIVCQIVLGYYLSKNDFSIYAITLSLTSIAGVLKNGGSQQYLIQKGINFLEISGKILTFSYIFNFIIFVNLLLFGPFILKLYNYEEYYWLIALISVTFPLGTYVSIIKSKLTIDLDFKILQNTNILISFIQYSSIIILALCGFGVYSFVVSQIVAMVIEIIVFNKVKKIDIQSKNLSFNNILEILNDTKWIMLGSLAVSIVLYGDFCVIGLYVSPEILAVYFFGYQFVNSFTRIFSSSIESVALSAFSNISINRDVQNDYFKKTLEYLLILVCFFSMTLFIISESLVILLWDDVWKDSIIVVQILSISMIADVVSTFSRSMVESRGMWNSRAMLLWIEAIGTIIFATIGSMIGDVRSIALCIAVNKFISVLIHIFLVSKSLNVHNFKYLYIFLSKLISSILLVFCAFKITYLFSDELNLYEISFLKIMFFGCLYIIIIPMKYKKELVSFVKR